MSLIQDKLGNEFLRSSGSMDSNFGAGMIMFSHLPPVTSFTRLHTVMQDLPPQEMILKKERDSPDCSMATQGGSLADYIHTMGIKQEKLSEHDYRLPLYPGDLGKNPQVLEVRVGDPHNLHDLNMANQLPTPLEKEAAGRKGRRSTGDGQEGKPRKKRSEAKHSAIPEADGCSLSPGAKPHICEHCTASFRSSYHLRRHVLIHTGERPFRCSQCNMSFIQKYLLQRHEKIHSGEKPFSCDQCNMRFIQKYHMERHKRTHSGEKPYRCETCQQFFSRTDRLLKHKRTCGEATKKDADCGPAESGCADAGDGSYAVTQGNAGRKRGRSKNPAEGKKRKGEVRGAQHAHGGYEFQTVTSTSQLAHHRAPKAACKKAGRKSLEKFKEEPGGLMEGLTQDAKAGNYDDAMQFLKKRRYLQPANGCGAVGGEYDVQQSSIAQADADASLGLDKSGIPDEVLQSLLDHYAHKPEVHFDLGDQQAELSADGDASGDKTALMSEYSRFLLQALERSTHSAGFPLGPPAYAHSHPGNIYAASSLDCGFGQSASSSVPKSLFAAAPPGSSPQHGFHLSGLDAQQLTPSQELSEQLEKQHPAPSFQIGPSDSKEASMKNGAVLVFPLQDLDSSKPSYHIEHFAQAFGAQFKSEGHDLSYGADSGGEVEHRIRTPVSEFSGYSSLSDVSEPVTSGSKTQTSQSYR